MFEKTAPTAKRQINPIWDDGNSASEGKEYLVPLSTEALITAAERYPEFRANTNQTGIGKEDQNESPKPKAVYIGHAINLRNRKEEVEARLAYGHALLEQKRVCNRKDFSSPRWH